MCTQFLWIAFIFQLLVGIDSYVFHVFVCVYVGERVLRMVDMKCTLLTYGKDTIGKYLWTVYVKKNNWVENYMRILRYSVNTFGQCNI